MLILVLCHPADGADQAEFRRLVPEETAALRETEDQSRAGRRVESRPPGRRAHHDVPDEAEAERLTASLPLVQAGLISTEIVPLHPMDL